MGERRWTDTDRELVREAIHSKFDNVDEQTAAVLEALTAAGWRREADVRAEVAHMIALAIDALDVQNDPETWVLDRAAAIARAHATTPEEPA